MTTRDEAIKAAIEAGMTCYGCKSEKLGHSWHSYTDAVERLYALAFKAGMERAAEIAEARYVGDNNREDAEARRIAEAIREEAKK